MMTVIAGGKVLPVPQPFCVKSTREPRAEYHAYRVGDDNRPVTSLDMLVVAQAPNQGMRFFNVENRWAKPPVRYAVAVARPHLDKG